MRIFDNLLEKALSEGIEWIYYDDNGLSKKAKVYTQVNSEKFAKLVKYAVESSTTSIAGYYVMDIGDIILRDRDHAEHSEIKFRLDIGDIILWDRDHAEHSEIRSRFDLNDFGLIGFYIIPCIEYDEDGFKTNSNKWYIEISKWSTKISGSQQTLFLNKIRKHIQYTEKITGYRYVGEV